MTVADPPPFTPPQVPYVAVAPPSQPIITLLILLVLCAIFAAEMVYGIGPPTGTLQPSIETLVGFGGLSRDLVIQSGDWYRLFSAPFLHASAVHLGMNAVALWVAGRSLERLVGHAWFAATYAVGALGGSIASLELNPPGVIGIGASGAIMGLFATMLIISMHFPASPVRSALRSNAIYVLIPSLLPLANALKTETKVDYAAHTGGAIAGAVVGLLLLLIWPRSEPNPRLKGVAVFLALAGVVALVYPLNSVLQGGYNAAAFSQQLIPPDKYPKTGAEMRARASQLIAQYPRDPRPHFTRAADLLDGRDLAGAEREARAGLEEEYLWRTLLPQQVGDGLRTFLAIAISRDRPQEALATARPVCLALKDGPMRRMLDERRLCKT